MRVSLVDRAVSSVDAGGGIVATSEALPDKRIRRAG